jgi:hypothetical protein
MRSLENKLESSDEKKGDRGSSQGGWVARWKTAARAVKTQTYALALAYRDPRLSWPARLDAGLLVFLWLLLAAAAFFLLRRFWPTG